MQSNKVLFPIKDLGYVTAYIQDCVESSKITIAPLNEAPLWLRLFARGDYCAYKTTIYVPAMHYALVSSESTVDRNLSTAKLCKWFMAIHDHKEISRAVAIKLLKSSYYSIHYFLYEFFFLKGTEHPHADLIALGFMASRYTWYNRKLDIDKVYAYLSSLLATGAEKPPL